jgi:hypothetical protein
LAYYPCRLISYPQHIHNYLFNPFTVVFVIVVVVVVVVVVLRQEELPAPFWHWVCV